MRDKERLENFYAELKAIHKRSFPDLRFFQFVMCIIRSVENKRIDSWNLEENDAIKLIKEFEIEHNDYKRNMESNS